MKNIFYVLISMMILTNFSFTQDIWINEFSYDCIDAGDDTDGDEFVEIVGPVGRDMSQYGVVFFENRNDAYYAHSYSQLNGVITSTNSNHGKGYFVVKTNRSALLEQNTPIPLGVSTCTIESEIGISDNEGGILLVNNENGQIIHGVFYELPVERLLPNCVYSKLPGEFDWASTNFEISSSFSDHIFLPVEDGEASNPYGSISMIGAGFSRLWVGTNGDAPNTSTPGSLNYSQSSLPVELAFFSASVTEIGIILNWRTETETNNFGFEVERSSIKSDWKKIGFVNGNGNSNSPKDYSFVDAKVSSDKYSYRLKQIDNDGQFEYSKPVEVDLNVISKFELSQNFPNPFNPSTTIRFNLPEASIVKLTLFNILGQELKTIVNEFKDSGVHTLSFDASELNSGIYIYKIEAGSFTQTRKMTLLK